MEQESRLPGYLAVAAGFLTHLMIGAIFIWGNIVVYITSYFRLYNPDLTMEDTFILFPVQVILNNVIMYIGSLIALNWHPKVALGLSTLCMFLGCFFSSYMTSWGWFFVLYGLVVTIGVGFGYTAPLIVAWSYFPEKKGRVSGLITCGFGFSAGIFNLVSTAMINPDNADPDITVHDGRVTNYYYSASIADGVPGMLRGLAYIWVVIGVIATILLPGVKKAEKKVDYRYP
ncbi:MAG: hypothetical protein V2I33_24435 [Kangiellaceae bacterium]|jgi:hypothetical protein|nr:hypothetical protein [Kangiellaceae bacterium]